MITIYALHCRINGFAYIGSTKGKIGKRMREHRCLLNAGEHKTTALQADWRLYGESCFEMRPLEVISGTLAERRQAEVRWMEVYRATGALYNEHLISMRPSDEAIRRGVASAHNKPGNRWTPEANEARRCNSASRRVTERRSARQRRR